ncbi:hypothetical protein [Candidatus Burkholderia verschuerenii]|uniref:hypothetical protein n=1 Tax=Candidatus Burkholderia verschuerenii TaxID=242163 RepID=UPI00067E17D8|nr:hypothetical protein [Candidatus Burkholderia verschuerenii]
MVPAGTHYSDLANSDGTVDVSKLIGGVLLVVGADQLELALAPGDYWLYEFVIGRNDDGSLRYTRRNGWDFTAEIDGRSTAPLDDSDGAVPFTIALSDTILTVVGFNKSVCVEIEKQFSGGKGRKEGVLFLGTDAWLNFTDPTNPDRRLDGITRLGVTDANGRVRLDGFTSGNNVFIHELVPKADYLAGVRPSKMNVYNIDGSFWNSYGFPVSHEVTQGEIDLLLANQKFTPAGHDIIREHMHAGDWLFSNQDNYFFQRQGVMRCEVINDNGPKGKMMLSKKIWSGVAGPGGASA